MDFPQPFLSWIFLILWMLAGATNEGNHFFSTALPLLRRPLVMDDISVSGGLTPDQRDVARCDHKVPELGFKNYTVFGCSSHLCWD